MVEGEGHRGTTWRDALVLRSHAAPVASVGAGLRRASNSWPRDAGDAGVARPGSGSLPRNRPAHPSRKYVRLVVASRNATDGVSSAAVSAHVGGVRVFPSGALFIRIVSRCAGSDDR